jgi:hypothetical protein
MTSPNASNSADESTRAYVNGPVVQVPLPTTVTADPATLQQIITTVMSVLGLAFHLWNRNRKPPQ